jgi:hypothetical protein
LSSRHASPARWTSRRLTSTLAGVALVFISAPAGAADAFGERTTSTPALARVEPETASGDGVYGRLAGDLTLAAAAGVEVDFSSSMARPLFMATARYFSTVGVYGVLREGIASDDDAERILGTGVLVEPLFVARAVKNMQQGPAFWDLALDSVGLNFGVFWAEPMGGDLGDQRGAELGLGAGLPLLGTAAGPWLRVNGQLRWDEASSASTSLWVTLEWRAIMNTGLTGGQNIGD